MVFSKAKVPSAHPLPHPGRQPTECPKLGQRENMMRTAEEIAIAVTDGALGTYGIRPSAHIAASVGQIRDLIATGIKADRAQLADEAREIMEGIEESRSSNQMSDVFEARDNAEDFIARVVNR